MFYLNLFLFFSIFGYLYETMIRLIHHFSLTNLLIGPWMPIYGFGILTIELINQLLSLFKIKGKKKIIICFVLSILSLTILEFIGGKVVEILFKSSFWNYESIPLNIGKYINVLVSLIWGIGGMIVEYIFIPILTPFLKKIPKWISFFILSFILLDHTVLIVKVLLQ